ncbi:MAG: hypothetical protein IIB61_04835 [Planctomycetes bacterium]|nr:hypothetical protein [Planctomycetota bacterium]
MVKWHRAMIAAIAAGGCLFGGPCGITSLQLKDFAQSALIRTGVTTFASLLEAATIEQAQGGTSDGG